MTTARFLRTHVHGQKWGTAFMAGLARHGIAGVTGAADLLVVWGVRAQHEIAAQLSRGGEVCVLECGYIGDRLKWASASLGGGLNGRGRFAPLADNGARFKQLWPGFLKPWLRSDGYALICGQVPGDMSVFNVDLDGVFRQAANDCRRLGYEPFYRPHPKAATPAPGCAVKDGTLAEALAGAAFVVTWNSNSGVDAALAGVPVVALDRGSMAWEIASRHVAPPWRPDRFPWAAALAWKQWSPDEFASGATWDHLKGALCTTH